MRRADAWAMGAIVAGFVATIWTTVVLLGAYLVVRAVGSSEADVPWVWFWALSHNRVVDFTTGSPYVLSALHLSFGIAWAFVYAAFAEPWLTGPGWRRGVLFSLVPWLASVVVFLPSVGAGVFGLGLEAGPLPALGNLILHLAYGAVLGDLYARARRSTVAFEDLPEQVASMLRAERGTAIGLCLGTAVGLGVGVFGARMLSTELVPAAELGMPLSGALVGCALGVLIGSMVGTYAVSAKIRTATDTTRQR